ncbi:hypothetical protein MVEN_01731000 [Mycena venus]|uniref:Uncharacterized protein n=1 Tax=Mycena venus TaxID=2733690 RepID=A0A8H6XMA8_9AGAR|nr:hypothetical protein MVEN_01731000 [Mycena venus]
MLDIIVYILSLILAVSAMILPTALILGITMPFTGVLVRYRANYRPKRGLRLDGEDEMDVTRADTDSYFGMMKRVHRIEGWAGLYKGFIPSIVAVLITSGIVLWIISFTISLVPVILLIPMQIITNRAITTPHKLSAFAPKAALQVLLSSAERAQPWRLFFAPGVALSEVLQGLVPPTLSILVQFVPGLYLSHRLPILIAALPLIALATVLLTPLQVMGARLTLQRLGDGPETSLDAPPPEYGVEEVMEFRTQHAPYASLFDCGKQMVVEEGWRSLLRAWWVTPLWIMLSIGGAMAQ